MSRIESAGGLKGPSVAAEVSSTNPAHQEALQEVQAVNPSGPGQYISPVVTVDNSSGLAIIEFRDGQTGETEVQWPSPKAVQQYIARASDPQQDHAGDDAGAHASGTQQQPKSEAAGAQAAQESDGKPAAGSTAPQSGGATAHVSLIA